MSTPRRKGRRKTRRPLWRRVSRALVRRTKRGIKAHWGKVQKAFEPRVIKNYKRDSWASQYPNPKRPQPLVMTRVDAEDESEVVPRGDIEINDSTLAEMRAWLIRRVGTVSAERFVQELDDREVLYHIDREYFGGTHGFLADLEAEDRELLS